MIPLTRAELDITSQLHVREVISRLRPTLLLNCTAVGVDLCETNPTLARSVNVDGPSFLAAAAADAGAEFVHFSTNYVFDGSLEPPRSYTTEDEALPINVYGQTKLDGERAVVRAHPGSFIVRTSWVFGAGKENFFSSLSQRLRDGIETQVVRDMWASTTYVDDLAPALSAILEHGEKGTYHLVNHGVCSYEMFAREVARRLELRDEQTDRLLNFVTQADLKRAAPRPRYSPMSCLLSSRLGLTPMRGWQEALHSFMEAS